MSRKYEYYINGNEVIAVTHCGKKSFRGVAKCDPKDTFDENLGRALARARCEVKINNFLKKEDSKDFFKFVEMSRKLDKKYENIMTRYRRHDDAAQEAKANLDRILNKVKAHN